MFRSSQTTARSDAHRHHDIPVHGPVVITTRSQLARAVRILEPEHDLLVRNHPQEIHEVLSIEADFHRFTVVLRGHALLAFAGFRNRRVDLDLTRAELNADRARAFVGELGYALDRRAEFIALKGYRIRLILRQHALEIGEVARELAGQQHAIA